MKIEKGKLYYNHQLERVIKAQTDHEDKSGLNSDKIAVHCPTKEYWDYVQSKGYNLYKYWGGYSDEPYFILDGSGYVYLTRIDIDNYHTITIEQFKQFYSMKEQTEPQYFAISKEEWQEYQDLKSKKQVIDYDRLKTGSRVMLKETGFICDHNKVDFNSEFFVILFKSKNFITRSGKFGCNGDNSEYCTFYQSGNFVLYSSDLGIDYITEVIEY